MYEKITHFSVCQRPNERSKKNETNILFLFLRWYKYIIRKGKHRQCQKYIYVKREKKIRLECAVYWLDSRHGAFRMLKTPTHTHTQNA